MKSINKSMYKKIKVSYHHSDHNIVSHPSVVISITPSDVLFVSLRRCRRMNGCIQSATRKTKMNEQVNWEKLTLTPFVKVTSQHVLIQIHASRMQDKASTEVISRIQ